MTITPPPLELPPTDYVLAHPGSEYETEYVTGEDAYSAYALENAIAERDAWWAAQIEALRADAERYRWLRAQREWHEMNRTQDAMWTCSMPAVEVDAAIDAARTKEQA